ncbi:MAG: hypothetical protein ACK4FW_13190, partial [Stenotrophomonas sp.]
MSRNVNRNVNGSRPTVGSTGQAAATAVATLPNHPVAKSVGSRRVGAVNPLSRRNTCVACAKPCRA